MAANNLSDYVPGGRPLTGWSVLIICIAFFGFVAVVDGVMAHYALSTFRGEVVDNPYEAGLGYDKDIAAAAAQDARNWAIDVRTQRGADGQLGLTLVAKDGKGAAITDVAFTITLEAPADMNLDRTAQMTETSPGVYAGALNAPKGEWVFSVAGQRRGEQVFLSNSRIMLR